MKYFRDFFIQKKLVINNKNNERGQTKMNTDLELYRVFCEVVKYKNISKTAESMYISQSAVTQSIQK